MVDDASRRLAHVHSCWNDAEADIVISFLASHGIEAVSSSRVTHDVFPLVADGLGEIRIFVAEDLVEQTARAFDECEAFQYEPLREVPPELPPSP